MVLKQSLDKIPDHLPEELITLLHADDSIRIERIVSQGHASADGFWYDQPQHEWVLVLQGAARLQFAEEMVELTAGDFVNIPARCKHRVAWTTNEQPTIWLAIHYGETQG